MIGNRVTDSELFGSDREEVLLRQFRSLLADLVRIMRHALGARTVALHWVNRQRGIFVPEAHASSRADVVFRDRIPFESTFMDRLRDLQEPVWLRIGKDVQAEEMTHYYDRNTSVSGNVFVQPFLSNKETVALTVIETELDEWTPAAAESLTAYSASIDNLLQTYLELSNLLDAQKGWVDYDKALDEVLRKRDAVAILLDALKLSNRLLPGSASLLYLKNGTGWNLVGRLGSAKRLPPLGQGIDAPSLAAEAVAQETPVFGIHLNGSPRKAFSRESVAQGASMALPVRAGEGVQALFLVNHPDVLAFNDANRHQLANLVRAVSQKLSLLARGSRSDQVLASNGVFRSELSDAVIEAELQRLREEPSAENAHSWVGYATPVDYAGLRTRLSPDALKQLQRLVLAALDPSPNGFDGLVAFHADHIHLFVVQGENADDIERWGKNVTKRLSKPLSLDGEDVSLRLHIAAVPLRAGYADAYAVTERARRALSMVSRSGEGGLEVAPSALE